MRSHAPTQAARAPGHYVFVYDGDCGFCTRMARSVAARARSELQLMPFTEIPPGELLTRLSTQEIRASSHLITPAGGNSTVATASPASCGSSQGAGSSPRWTCPASPSCASWATRGSRATGPSSAGSTASPLARPFPWCGLDDSMSRLARPVRLGAILSGRLMGVLSDLRDRICRVASLTMR